MGFWEDLMAKLRGASRRSAEAVDQELAADFAKLQQANTVDLEALKPQLSDDEAFDALVAAVRDSTARNENLAQLQIRIKALGENVVGLASKAVKLL